MQIEHNKIPVLSYCERIKEKMTSFDAPKVRIGSKDFYDVTNITTAAYTFSYDEALYYAKTGRIATMGSNEEEDNE
jgi:hypothetical protein